MAENDEFFPSSPRVVYASSPLNEVICQVRFPPILKIDSQPPAEFQEQIRNEFPLFEKQGAPQIGAQLPAEIANMIGMAAQQPQYVFRSENGQRHVALSNSALAITTNAYSRWEQFVVDVKMGLSALEQIYRPSFYQRIGLRYQNLISPEKLGFGPNSWPRVLSDNVLGELRQGNFGPGKVIEAQRSIRIVSDTLDGVLLQHGIGRLQGDASNSYIIDIDCYTDLRTEAKDAIDVLERFNARARRGFRWCITDELHNALKPEDVASDDTK